MKQVLLIGASYSFCEYLTEGLSQQQVKLDHCPNVRSAYTDLIQILPDLIIIDVGELNEDVTLFLEKKVKDPNAKSTPIIAIGELEDRKQIASLANFKVHKYFKTPIKYDQFFKAIGEALGLGFTADTTDCILEMHVTDNIFFIEIARGLNRDKISMLRYRLDECKTKLKMSAPKLVLMLSDVKFCFLDMTNISLLLDTILADRIIKKSNIKIVTNDTFLKDFVNGHDEYKGIEITSDIGTVLNPLLEIFAISESKDPLLHRILIPNKEIPENALDLRFSSDYDGTMMTSWDTGDIMRVAIIDDDPVSQKLLVGTFEKIKAKVTIYSNGISFLKELPDKVFDVVILDIFIPNMTGLDVLRNLQRQKYSSPVLVYSQATDKEYVTDAISLGAANFIAKPQKPDVIIQAALSALGTTGGL
ncbi:MAG: response regulator [Treponema sp.]|nr:response regulator [Treponema sp.]